MPSNEHKSSPYISPVARKCNLLLRGDCTNNNGACGVIVRTPWSGSDLTEYLPSTLLLASMRAPNSMFSHVFKAKHNRRKTRLIDKGARVEITAVALLVGSKSKLNSDGNQASDVVECRACYPIDAHYDLTRRNHSLTNADGGSCYAAAGAKTDPLCINEKCLTDTDHNCICNYKLVAGSQVGMYLGHFKPLYTHSQLCWYPSSTRALIHDLVDASNSIYLNREAIFSKAYRPLFLDSHYKGWNECTCSLNSNRADLNDAIVIKLPPTERTQDSLRTLSKQGDGVRHSLQEIIGLDPGYQKLPIIIMQETKGMPDSECKQYWGGYKCQEGYRKEFFTEQFVFSDGSCLARNEDSEEVYYHPPNHTLCLSPFPHYTKELKPQLVQNKSIPVGIFSLLTLALLSIPCAKVGIFSLLTLVLLRLRHVRRKIGGKVCEN